MTSARRISSAALVLTGLALAAGCGGSSSAGSAAAANDAITPSSTPSSAIVTPSTSTPASATDSNANANGQADLVLSGAITKRLTAAPAYCDYYYPSEKRGVVYTVDSGNLSLQVSDSEGDGRTVVLLNVSGPGSASYGSPIGAPGTLVANKDRSGARLDIDLHKVLSSSTIVHVSGTITCST